MEQKEIIKKNNKKNVVENEKQVEIISKQKLLEAGTYFGRKASLWNPKMKPFIYTKKMGNHIIDTSKTQKALEFAYKLIYKYASKGASFIFVGTKKQAKKVVEAQAARTNSDYVSERWLGGTLTNSRTIFSRVRYMSDLEKMAESNFPGYTKVEALLKRKELDKLHKNLNGIRNMKQLPQVMIVVDPKLDEIAVKEARKKKVKIISILNTDADPDMVDLGIPANDNSVKSITLIITILADAIVSAKKGVPLFAYQPDEKIVLPEDANKEKTNSFVNNSGEKPNFEKNNTNKYKNKENNQKEKKEVVEQ
ncbi:30S ribosomal protein S2 [Mesomycoplasma neurolyticum]|uniref:Small ribosomal subunit protein uS2 n=1 Tax=Mesomycoplasma neurolyticum TaxID=2120 RepID=A0A449A4P0_9BACT|nr:30S ribosomal protein S2 [Mesomycoplasma neurolyticum]VEU59196.1 Vegetative protein 209 [Mesomycoplasma neurolyticum]